MQEGALPERKEKKPKFYFPRKLKCAFQNGWDSQRDVYGKPFSLFASGHFPRYSPSLDLTWNKSEYPSFPYPEEDLLFSDPCTNIVEVSEREKRPPLSGKHHFSDANYASFISFSLSLLPRREKERENGTAELMIALVPLEKYYSDILKKGGVKGTFSILQ